MCVCMYGQSHVCKIKSTPQVSGFYFHCVGPVTGLSFPGFEQIFLLTELACQPHVLIFKCLISPMLPEISFYWSLLRMSCIDSFLQYYTELVAFISPILLVIFHCERSCEFQSPWLSEIRNNGAQV